MDLHWKYKVHAKYREIILDEWCDDPTELPRRQSEEAAALESLKEAKLMEQKLEEEMKKQQEIQKRKIEAVKVGSKMASCVVIASLHYHDNLQHTTLIWTNV